MKKRGMATDALLLTISRVVTLGVSMISAMLLSRLRSLTEYGTYSQVIMVITIAISIFTFGMPNSVNYFLARSEGPDESRSFLSTYYCFNTLMCVLMGVVLVLGLPLAVAYFDNEGLRSFGYAFALLPWATVISASISNVLIVYHRATAMIAYNIAHSVLTLGVIIVVEIFKLDFYTYMYGYVAVQCAFALAVYFIVWRIAGGLNISINGPVLKAIVKYSIPIGVAAIMGTLLIEMDKLMIGGFYDTDQLAIYTNASREMPVSVISASISAVLIPNMARLLKYDRKEEAADIWKRSVVLSSGLISFIAFALMAFAPQVITVLYSEKYLPGVGVFRIYSMVLLFRVTYYGMVLSSMNKNKYILLSSALSFIPNIALNYILYKLIGFEGPAVASLICIAGVMLYQLYYSAKVTGIRFRDIYPWKRIAQITLINALPCCAIILAYHLFGVGTSALHIGLSVGIGVAWAAVYLLSQRKKLLSDWRSLNDAKI